MLAYAADAPRFAERRRNPKALLLIAAVHVVLLGAVMSAKMEIARHTDPPIVVTPIPLDPDPPPVPPEPQADPRPYEPRVTQAPPLVPTPPLINPLPLDPPLPLPPLDPGVSGSDPGSRAVPNPPPVRAGPRFATPPSVVRPPYPERKRHLEEEATLKLRLAIDVQGRVIGVTAVGAADPVFLDAARRHILARWRYKPATEDGRAVASSTVVTLRFQLED